MSHSATGILKEHQLRVTKGREAILHVFLSNKGALSHSDIEQALASSQDRVTIYRSLNSFIEKGVVHKVLDDSGAAKFALCAHDHHAAEKHSDDHVHFKCTNCGTTECIDETAIPTITLPKGYTMHELNFLVQGLCKKCNTAA